MLYILITLVLILIIWFISNNNLNFIVGLFKNNNVIVFGKKGTGKDLLFHSVIRKRKQLHYSNITFNNKTMPISISELSLFPNTYESLINGNVVKVDPNLKEKYDIYISDGGIYLPSQFDYLIDKKYPSLSIFYAVQRHLYNSNTHMNTQYLGRIYKKVREQADTYIKLKRSIFILGMYISFYTIYEKYESADLSLMPMENKLLNGFNNGLVQQYQATNGYIKNGWYIGLKNKINYNTRYFRKVFLNDQEDKNNVN
jgi:hypothetical protein